MKTQRWIRFASIGFCLSIVLALGFAPAISAQQDSDQPPSDNPQCTDADLQGRYGYIVSGWLVGLVPVAAVGVVTFDGEGTILNAQDTFNNSQRCDQPQKEWRGQLYRECELHGLRYSRRRFRGIDF